jgi:Ca2+/H+ antiporter, TMEM165/GDT1 family
MLNILLASYVSVLVAELVGDKMVYTIAALSARFKPAHVLSGMIAAYLAKTLAAVELGSVITKLPRTLVSAASTATFFMAALFIWRNRPEERVEGLVKPSRWSNGAAVSFATIFFSEWADVGQIATVALVARFHHPMLVWVGAALALCTKGTVAVIVGGPLLSHVPSAVLRTVAASWCLALGTLSLIWMLRGVA